MARLKGSPPLRLEFEIGPDGAGRVILGGKDVSNYVKAIEFQSRIGTSTEAVLTFVNVEAIAEIKADSQLLKTDED